MVSLSLGIVLYMVAPDIKLMVNGFVSVWLVWFFPPLYLHSSRVESTNPSFRLRQRLHFIAVHLICGYDKW